MSCQGMSINQKTRSTFYETKIQGSNVLHFWKTSKKTLNLIKCTFSLLLVLIFIMYSTLYTCEYMVKNLTFNQLLLDEILQTIHFLIKVFITWSPICLHSYIQNICTIAILDLHLLSLVKKRPTLPCL